MIQIISNDVSRFSEYSDKIYKISKLGEIQALDDFEICVIDLSTENLWYFKGDNPTNLNSFHDLLTLKEAILNRKKSKILIIFPQNETFYYNYNHHYKGGYSYDASVQIKDNKDNVIQIISKCLYELGNLKIAYERTNTKINDNTVSADFNFTNVGMTEFKPVTYSSNSNKITTIKKEKIFLTTLNISKEEKNIINFINLYCKKDTEKENIPEWVYNIRFYNDEQLIEDKNINNEKIKKLEEKNIKLDEQLKKNLEYKSILYTTGDELVKVVSEILDELLEYDSGEFIDEGKEDFLIKKDDVTFVGEIKGISSAVQNKNVSQLEVHIQNYFDKLNEEGKDELIKGLLIINHQRNKDINERQEVHEHQKKLAEKYGSAIIETHTLLKMYEMYKRGDLSKEECKKILKEKIGLIEL